VAGLEAWHPTHTVIECRQLERIAAELGLFVTGGSDYHGDHMPSRTLGLTAGGRQIADELLLPLTSLHPAGR
jgi:hypothetical protein